MMWGPPKWIPLSGTGWHWRFMSGRGRHLGTVVKLSLPSDPEPVWGKRECCGMDKFFPTISAAARYVEQTLNCVPCAQKAIKRELDRFTS